jgi:tetraacyldisaccharide 4'-kinase
LSKSAKFEAMITRAWMRRGVIACLLYPLSLVMAGVVRLRQCLYALGLKKTTYLPVPVIVVGNVFVGGTGKTPLTMHLVEVLRAAGYHPGVVSRGYGRQSEALVAVSAQSSPTEVGDEPLLIAKRAACPVYVGRQRVAAACALLAQHPEVDVIISDDGLQHYALGRQIDIVLSDLRGNGNGWLLPAGPLREFADRARDFNVVNVGTSPTTVPLLPTSAPTFAMALETGFAEQLCDRQQRRALSAFDPHLSIAALAGIGSPARFFASLAESGLRVASYPLPDHYDFQENPFQQIAADIFLITEKDAVKCAMIDAIKQDPRIWVVPVSARIDSLFTQLIVEKLREFQIT